MQVEGHGEKAGDKAARRGWWDLPCCKSLRERHQFPRVSCRSTACDPQKCRGARAASCVIPKAAKFYPARARYLAPCGDTRHPRGPPQFPKRASAKSLGSKQTELYRELHNWKWPSWVGPQVSLSLGRAQSSLRELLQARESLPLPRTGPQAKHCMG